MLMQCRTSPHHYFLCDDELIPFHFLFILCKFFFFFWGGGGGGGLIWCIYSLHIFLYIESLLLTVIACSITRITIWDRCNEKGPNKHLRFFKITFFCCCLKCPLHNSYALRIGLMVTYVSTQVLRFYCLYWNSLLYHSARSLSVATIPSSSHIH